MTIRFTEYGNGIESSQREPEPGPPLRNPRGARGLDASAMRDEPARDETRGATSRAVSSSMPSVMVSIQLTVYRETLT